MRTSAAPHELRRDDPARAGNECAHHGDAIPVELAEGPVRACTGAPAAASRVTGNDVEAAIRMSPPTATRRLRGVRDVVFKSSRTDDSPPRASRRSGTSTPFREFTSSSGSARRTGKTFLAWRWRSGIPAQGGEADRLVRPAWRRGSDSASSPGIWRKGEPVPAPPARRALHHARFEAGGELWSGGRSRWPRGLHAGPHPERLLRHPRRGAEHDLGKMKMFLPGRLRFPGGDHGDITQTDLPSGKNFRAETRRSPSSTGWRGSGSAGSPTSTWSGTPSSRRSSGVVSDSKGGCRNSSSRRTGGRRGAATGGSSR